MVMKRLETKMNKFEAVQCNSLKLMTLDLTSSTLIIHHLSLSIPLNKTEHRLAACLMNFVYDQNEILNYINHDKLSHEKLIDIEGIFNDFSRLMSAYGVPDNFINYHCHTGCHFNFTFLQKIDTEAKIIAHHSSDKAMLLAQFNN